MISEKELILIKALLLEELYSIVLMTKVLDILNQ